MKLVEMTCPHCCAHLKIDPDRRQGKCEYCGSTLLIEDEAPGAGYENAEEAGYNFEKGRQRALAEAGADYADAEPVKRRRTWLWVLGWICIFPLPLTILLIRKKDMNPVIKYVIIAAAWIIYLFIGLSNRSSDGGADMNARTRSEAFSYSVTEL
ncbi:MAG: hypothetical protein J5827_05440 [Oscillospiraceae bacterium]|nr:hypothetical protein [Oscillospiraceae bacterium]